MDRFQVVPTISQATESGIAYRECLPDGWDGSRPTALMLHGYPTSSYLWRNVMPAGRRRPATAAIAIDLPGFGDSPADLPGTWERQIEHVERFREPWVSSGWCWSCTTGAG